MQAGEQGSRLQLRPEPDEVILYVPGACRSCGDDLGGAPVVGVQARQVFDLPPIELVVVEHRAQRRACSCGAVTTATFPPQATAPTCY
jgi:transposase